MLILATLNTSCLDVNHEIARWKSRIAESMNNEAGSNYEKSNQIAACLSLNRDYSKYLQHEMVKLCDSTLRRALEGEDRAWQIYHRNCQVCYDVIAGGPESTRGNSWERESGYYELSDYDMLIPCREAFLNELIGVEPNTLSTRKWEAVSEKDVSQAYILFPVFQSEYTLSEYEQRSALEKERAAWDAWITIRSDVSKHLTGRLKEVYDYETARLLRFKYVMLKNGLKLNNDYCPAEDAVKLTPLP